MAALVRAWQQKARKARLHIMDEVEVRVMMGRVMMREMGAGPSHYYCPSDHQCLVLLPLT